MGAQDPSRWWIGAIINLIGSISINLGTNLIKLGHNKRAELDMPEEQKPPIRKMRYWQLGFAVLMCGNALNFVSFGYAAQSLLAALGSVQFVSNVVFASLVLKEKVTFAVIVATALIVGGCVVLVLFGNHSSVVYSVQELMGLYRKVPYLVFVAVVLSSFVGTYLLYRRGKRLLRTRPDASRRWIMLLPVFYATFSALIGAQSVLFSKSCSALLRATVAGDNQLRFWFTWVAILALIVTAVFWMMRLNKGLRLFPALLIVPTMQIGWTLMSIVSGMLYFQEYKQFTTVMASMFSLGVITMFFGVYLLTRSQADAARQAQAAAGQADAEGGDAAGGETEKALLEGEEEDDEDGETSSKRVSRDGGARVRSSDRINLRDQVAAAAGDGAPALGGGTTVFHNAAFSPHGPADSRLDRMSRASGVSGFTDAFTGQQAHYFSEDYILAKASASGRPYHRQGSHTTAGGGGQQQQQQRQQQHPLTTPRSGSIRTSIGGMLGVGRSQSRDFATPSAAQVSGGAQAVDASQVDLEAAPATRQESGGGRAEGSGDAADAATAPEPAPAAAAGAATDRKRSWLQPFSRFGGELTEETRNFMRLALGLGDSALPALSVFAVPAVDMLGSRRKAGSGGGRGTTHRSQQPTASGVEERSGSMESTLSRPSASAAAAGQEQQHSKHVQRVAAALERGQQLGAHPPAGGAMPLEGVVEGDEEEALQNATPAPAPHWMQRRGSGASSTAAPPRPPSPSTPTSAARPAPVARTTFMIGGNSGGGDGGQPSNLGFAGSSLSSPSASRKPTQVTGTDWPEGAELDGSVEITANARVTSPRLDELLLQPPGTSRRVAAAPSAAPHQQQQPATVVRVRTKKLSHESLGGEFSPDGQQQQQQQQWARSAPSGIRTRVDVAALMQGSSAAAATAEHDRMAALTSPTAADATTTTTTSGGGAADGGHSVRRSSLSSQNLLQLAAAVQPGQTQRVRVTPMPPGTITIQIPHSPLGSPDYGSPPSAAEQHQAAVAPLSPPVDQVASAAAALAGQRVINSDSASTSASATMPPPQPLLLPNGRATAAAAAVTAPPPRQRLSHYQAALASAQGSYVYVPSPKGEEQPAASSGAAGGGTAAATGSRRSKNRVWNQQLPAAAAVAGTGSSSAAAAGGPSGSLVSPLQVGTRQQPMAPGGRLALSISRTWNDRGTGATQQAPPPQQQQHGAPAGSSSSPSSTVAERSGGSVTRSRLGPLHPTVNDGK